MPARRSAKPEEAAPIEEQPKAVPEGDELQMEAAPTADEAQMDIACGELAESDTTIYRVSVREDSWLALVQSAGTYFNKGEWQTFPSTDVRLAEWRECGLLTVEEVN
jgi:hypothetical protein